MSTLQEALDEAVIAYRDKPTPENRERLMFAMELFHNDFLRRERDEALARGIEIYAEKKEKDSGTENRS